MMTTAQLTFDQLLAALSAGTAQLGGRDGKAIRRHVERLAELLQAPDPDGQARVAAAAELEQLVAVLAKAGAGIGQQLGGIAVGRIGDGLRLFADWLRAPSETGRERVEQLVAELQGGPVPLDKLRLGGAIEPLAIEAARRRGLEGAEARRAVEQMKGEMQALLGQLERRARDDAERARAATDFSSLIERIVALHTLEAPLGAALAAARGPLEHAFRRVDLAHMAEGLRVLSEWVAAPAEDDDAAAHVALLERRLAEVLGPPTAGDPTASEAERRADWEREVKAATDRIFGGGEPAS